ncbi:MAG: hypothetical protein H0U71_05940 [Gammaproteobacteria bacterium]|nr:hypothetical protein [Gammaproteobacteria bacterium]
MSLIHIASSRKILLLGIALNVFAITVLGVSALPFGYKCLAFGISLIYGNYYFKRYILLSHPRSVVALTKPSDTLFWTVTMANNQTVHAALNSNSLVTHFLLVLNFKCEQSLQLTTLLTPESIGYRNYRRLLVYLKHTHHLLKQ